MSPELQIVELALVLSGVVVLVVYLLVAGRGAWRWTNPAASDSNVMPARPGHSGIRPEHVALPMLVFLLVHMTLLDALAPEGAGPPAGVTDDFSGSTGPDSTDEVPEDVGLLANLGAQAVGGAACLVLARGRFAGGLRGFLLGPTPWMRSLMWAAGGLLAALPLCLLTEWLST